MKKKILIGISGGIAAFKVVDLVRHLIAEGFSVDVIMTKSATNIVERGQFEQLTGKKVFVDLFDTSFSRETILTKRSVDHVALGQKADLFVIVPATANIIAKLAHGIADDYLTTTALAATCPILVCPSMNVFMWGHPATQKNVETLKIMGIHTFGPDSGMLACGYEGQGRLPDMQSIETEVLRLLAKKNALNGKKVIVTAGGTTEPIDDVRVITNKSSGKMGVAIAESAFLHGAQVLLMRSGTSVRSRYGLKEIVFDTAADLREILAREVPSADICIHCAAVSDFKLKNPIRGKSSGSQPLSLELEPQTKILDTIKPLNPDILLVAFKAEYNIGPDKILSIARKRLANAKTDMIVVNDISLPDSGFQSDYNEVSIITSKGKIVHVPRATKQDVADRIIEEITALASGSHLKTVD